MGKILEKIFYDFIGISFGIEINFYECGPVCEKPASLRRWQ
jgi:hypothetical protein